MSFIGVDLGGTKILCREVDPETGASSGRVKAPTPKNGVESVLDEIAALVTKLTDGSAPTAVGVGVPGLVDRHGVVQKCPNIAGWDQPVDVAAGLRERLGVPIAVGNDVNCGALGEHRLGAGRGHDDVLAVFVGTGVGGGLVLDGRIRHGSRGLAGEIGHVTIGSEGRRCGCGGYDHLETYAGRAGIEREARRRVAEGDESVLVSLAGTATIKSRHIARALDEGCASTEDLMASAVDALGRGIGNLASVLDIECVVLGGGVVDKLGQPFVDRIAASANFGGFGTSTAELRLAHRLDDAGVVGAAILAAESAD